MKLEITLKVEDSDENIVHTLEEALSVVRYNYTNWGSAYCLRKWRNDLEGYGYGIRRAHHSDGDSTKWTSHATISNF